jgi:hypothetical protein
MSKNTKLPNTGKTAINSSQFIPAVVGNMRSKLFTTTANKYNRNIAEHSEIIYHNLTENKCFGT